VITIANGRDVGAELRSQQQFQVVQTWLAFAQVVLGAFTLAGLWYARKSALAAKDSADVARRALEGLERPYLLINPIHPVYHGVGARDEVGPFKIQLRFNVHIVNHGRSPATIRALKLSLTEGDDPEQAVSRLADSVGEANWTVPPGGTLDRDCRAELSCSKEQQDRFDNLSRKTAIVVGFIDYEAVYGLRYRRWFCWSYDHHGQRLQELGSSKRNYDQRL
jgi:hypothetical protein